MASLHDKKILNVDNKTWEYSDTNPKSGRTTKYTECWVQIEGKDGPERMVFRTASEKLMKALKPGVTVRGYVFRDDDAKHPGEWRCKANGKDNPDLAGYSQDFGGSGHTTGGVSPAPAPAAQASYRLDELELLMDWAIERSEALLSELEDNARVRHAVALFEAAVRCGAKQEGQGSGQANRGQDEAVVGLVEKAIAKAGLTAQYEHTSISTAKFVELWQAAGGNEAAFVIAAKTAMDMAGGDEPPMSGDEDDVSDSDDCPF